MQPLRNRPAVAGAPAGALENQEVEGIHTVPLQVSTAMRAGRIDVCFGDVDEP